ncbi:MAG: hypothetical protein Q9174_000484 [Haloplaca sp. 1 TL-2023]
MAKTRGTTKPPDRLINTPAVTSTRTTAPKKKASTTTKAKSAVKTATNKAKDVAKDATTKANTSKPRVKKPAEKKTATGRVTKAKAAPKKKAPSTVATEAKGKKAAAKKAEGKKEETGPKTKNERDVTLMDKVQGVAEKIVAVVEGKPGKKAAATKKMRGTDGKGAKRGGKA